jgi:hypothetical protein
MAAPNIVNVETITGKTASVALTTGGADILANAAASGKVFKVNSLYIANIDGTNACEVDIKVGGEYIAKDVDIPAGSTLVMIDKESQIYIEENKKIEGVAEADSDLMATVSYEEIS